MKLQLNISQSPLSTQSFFDCSLRTLWEINFLKILLILSQYKLIKIESIPLIKLRMARFE